MRSHHSQTLGSRPFCCLLLQTACHCLTRHTVSASSTLLGWFACNTLQISSRFLLCPPPTVPFIIGVLGTLENGRTQVNRWQLARYSPPTLLQTVGLAPNIGHYFLVRRINTVDLAAPDRSFPVAVCSVCFVVSQFALAQFALPQRRSIST